MCVRCGTGRIAMCTHPTRHGDLRPRHTVPMSECRACIDARERRRQDEALEALRAKLNGETVVRINKVTRTREEYTLRPEELARALGISVGEQDEVTAELPVKGGSVHLTVNRVAQMTEHTVRRDIT